MKGWVAAGWEAAGGAVAGWGVEGWEAMAELAEMGVEAATSPASSLQRRGRCNVIQALDHAGGHFRRQVTCACSLKRAPSPRVAVPSNVGPVKSVTNKSQVELKPGAAERYS